MVSDFGIRLLIDAENRATPELEKIPGHLDKLRQNLKNTNEESARFGRGFHEGVRSVEVMSDAIVGRLNPALAGVINNLSMAARVATALPATMGAITIAVAAASAGIGIYIDRLKEVQQFAATFSQARMANDLGAVRSLLDANTKAWALYRVQVEQTQQPITGFLSLMDHLITRMQVLSTNTAELARQQRDLSASFPGMLGADLGIAATRVNIGTLGGQRGLVAGQLQAGLSTGYLTGGQVQGFTQQQLDLLSRQGSLEQQGAQFEIQKQIDAINTSNLSEGAKRTSVAFLQAFLDRQRDAIRASQATQRFGIIESGRASGLALQAGRSQPGVFGEPDFTTIPRIYGTEGDAAVLATRLGRVQGAIEAYPDFSQIPQITGREQDAPIARARAESERDRVTALSQAYGLTRQEQAAAALLVIDREKLSKLAQENLTVDQQNVIALEAQVKASRVITEEFERTNGVAGLAKGFRDAAEEAESAGRVMQDFARNTASSMQRSFSDLFFNVITGQFKSLPDIGRQFGLALARNLTDALAQSASAPLLRILSGIGGGGGQPGFFANFAGGGAGISGGDYPGLVAPQAGSSSNLSWLYSASAGGVGTVGATTSAESAALYDIYFGGPQSTSTFGSMAAGLGYAALIAGVGYGASRATGSQSAVISSVLTGITAGSAIAGLIGSAVGAVGVGGVGSGALAGLGAGAGAAVGIAGAGFGAALGFLFAGATADIKDPPRNNLPAIQATNFPKAIDADVRRVMAAQNFEELALAVQSVTHQAYGGGPGRGADDQTPGFATYIKGRQLFFPPETIESLARDLSEAPETFMAHLQMGISAQSLNQINSGYEQAVKTRAQVLNRFNLVPLAYEDVGPGLSRMTQIPFAAAASIPPGTRALATSSMFAINRLGLTPDEFDALLRRLREVNSQRDTIPNWPEGVFLKVA